MKKLVSVLTITTLAFGTANAEITKQERIDKCFEKGYIWDYVSEICVPADPCKNSKFLTYCIEDFRNTQVKTPEEARKLIDMYITERMGVEGGCAMGGAVNGIKNKANHTGQDYIGCHLKNGAYRQFEFGDVNNHGKSDYIQAACEIALNGNFVIEGLEVKFPICYSITEEQCYKISPTAKFAPTACDLSLED